MNNRISFRLRIPASSDSVSIRMLIYHRSFRPEGRLLYGTGEKVLPKLFDTETERPTKNKSLLKGLSREEQRTLMLLDDRLNFIYATARSIFEFFNYNNISFDSDIFRKRLDAELGNGNRDSGLAGGAPLPLNEYIVQYTEDIQKGKRLTASGNVFAPGSIKNYITFKSQFDLFQKKIRKQLNFADITQDFYNDFLQFLNTKNYSPNTIGKHIARIKKIMRSAKEEGLHANSEYEKKSFKVLQIETEHIYLTAEEVDAIYHLDLSADKQLDRIRDIFLIGCFLAQRVSDYNTIRPEHITKTSKGKRVLKLIQKKTGEMVMIPILPKLEAILKKYDYHPPKVTEQQLNEEIKNIGKEAKICELVEIEEIKGGRKIRKTVPKYELIKSHSARRTGATNMYLSGIPPIDIMKITGHKKESNFLKYIRVSKEETADKLADHPYFK